MPRQARKTPSTSPGSDPARPVRTACLRESTSTGRLARHLLSGSFTFSLETMHLWTLSLLLFAAVAGWLGYAFLESTPALGAKLLSVVFLAQSVSSGRRAYRRKAP
jgi:hypothetical protein